ncbi:hypothetical protein K6U67_01615 [Vibrio diabolicus]|nr:hypothetical protein [Vibrio diabolicus]MCG6219365.1 hypothetical protein [Vibrio diabolicus]
MKRLRTLASRIALSAAPSVGVAGGYQWTNDTERIHGEVMDSKQAAYEMGRDMMQS